MQDQKTNYGTEDKCSLIQQICVFTMLLRKTGSIHLALVGFTAGWLAGRQNAGGSRNL